jgi:hypothetical protein
MMNRPCVSRTQGIVAGSALGESLRLVVFVPTRRAARQSLQPQFSENIDKLVSDVVHAPPDNPQHDSYDNDATDVEQRFDSLDIVH